MRSLVKFISVFIFLSIYPFVYAKEGADYFPLAKGNYWVYKERIEIQDINGELEVESKYLGEKVRVKRIDAPRILKVLSIENRGNFKIAKMQEENFNGVTRFFYVVDKDNGEVHRYTEEEIKEVLTDSCKVNLSGFPEYIFPLEKDLKWGDPDQLDREDKMYFRYVENVEDIILPAGTFKNCFKIVYQSLPDETIEWLCPYVGIVRMEYHHHGTITDHISELKETNLK